MADPIDIDLFGLILNNGNRTDLNVGDGRSDDEDWYSWEATRIEDGIVYGDDERCAVIDVYGEPIENGARQFVVTWKEVFE